MELINYFFHIDQYLADVINFLGPFTYLLLFVIIFAETGLVITPFLPGDSLLFTVGTLAGADLLNVWLVYFLLLSAAVLGDTVNYWLGHYFGPKVFLRKNSRFFNKANLEKTRQFYEKHGGKTIIIARFVPIIRTFAPFVAGIGSMRYRTFIAYNVVGAFIWVTCLVFAGYYLGGLPFIKKNFEYAIFAIIFISLLPIIIEYINHKFKSQGRRKLTEQTSFQDIKNTFKKEDLTE